MKKESIIVVFGGKSTEHDISIITGLQVFANIDREKYNVKVVYISRTGEMFSGERLGKVSTFANFDKDDSKLKRVAFEPGSDYLFESKNYKKIMDKKRKKEGISNKIKFKPIFKVDCAVICCHGVNGEDGTLQGIFELSGIPYTSSGVLASAISMDKVIMKDIFVANKINTAKYKYFYKMDYKLTSQNILDDIENKLKYPVFVKPANLGSSIGISKCRNKEDLNEAIEIASNYDNRILVEEGIEDNIEVNCAVLGNSDYQISSKIEYPKSWSDFLNFEEKYIQRGKNSNLKVDERAQSNTVEETASNLKEIKDKQEILPEDIEEEVKQIAKIIFKIFNCSGVVRIDFLVEKSTNKIYINELNSIPGSLAFYLFKEQKYNFKDFLSRLIDIAKKEKEKKNSNKFLYESLALANFGEGSKTNK